MYRFPFFPILLSWAIIFSITAPAKLAPQIQAESISQMDGRVIPSVSNGRYSSDGLIAARLTDSAIDKVHPVLHQLAFESPDDQVQIIVQRAGVESSEQDTAQNAVTALGGSILNELSIINAFVAEMPAGQAPYLATASAIRWVSLDSPVVESGRSLQADGTSVAMDRFQLNQFDGSDGTVGWSEPWSELGETDGPDLGNVIVTHFMSGQEQGLRLQGIRQGVQRFVDFGGNQAGTLTFRYRRKDLTAQDHYLKIQASRDDGTTWTEIGRITGSGTDEQLVTESLDISAFASNATGIRFVTSPTMNEQTRVYIDDVQITMQPELIVRNPYTLFLPQVAMGGSGVFPTDGVQLDPVAEAPIEITSRRMVVDNRPQAQDRFTARSFAGSNGTAPWKSNWQELGEDDGIAKGYVRIKNSRRCANGYCLRIGARPSATKLLEGSGVSREIDLSKAKTAELSYKYLRYSNNAELTTFSTEISVDSGRTWTELRRYDRSGSDSGVLTERIDISAYISPLTQIRFVLSGTIQATRRNYVFIDDITVAYTPKDENSDNPNIIDGETGTQPFSMAARDSFNTIAYDENAGTIDWLDEWLEFNDDGSPYRGDVAIYWNELVMRGNNRRIQRSVNLADSDLAQLTFSYRRSGFDNRNDYIAVDVSNDDGETWREVQRISGPGDDYMNKTMAVDISEFASDQTVIRFSTSPNQGLWDQFYLDDVAVKFDCVLCLETAQLASEHVMTLEADKLWNSANFLQGQDVTVAVVDSGIANHPDFLDGNGESRILARKDFTGGNGDDFYGHGTHVAGTIGGNGRRSKRIFMGMAPRVNFVDIRVINDYGSGTTSQVVDGLQWILENKDEYNIRLANLSLNSSVAESYHVSPLNAALEILWFNGIVVVVSAGNNGQDGLLYPPANDPFLITVGATDTKKTKSDEDDDVASFSASGKAENGQAKPEIVVPGKAIIAVLASDDSNIIRDHKDHIVPGENGNNYFRMSGTSAASAVATGAVALLIQDEPELSPDQIKYRLLSTAKTKRGNNYLRIVQAVRGTSTDSANTGTEVSQLLFTGADTPHWDDPNWGSINWGSINWGSINWGSINWGSINWGSVNWDVENLQQSDDSE